METFNVKQLSNLSMIKYKELLKYKGYTDFSDDKKFHNEFIGVKKIGTYFDTQSSKNFGWTLGEKIPQINKEFDLIRFQNKKIIDIELKRSTNFESEKRKFKNQAKKNQFYLNQFNRTVNVYYFIYNSVTKNEKFYFYNSLEDMFQEIDFSNITSELSNKFNESGISLHGSSKFLVNPFSSPDKFIQEEYLLSSEQEKIFDLISNGKSMLIDAPAGTGKSLIALHVARHFKNHVYTIANATISDDKHQAFLKFKDINIKHVPIRELSNCLNFPYIELVIIDEAQRLEYDTRQCLINWFLSDEAHQLVMFYDHNQALMSKDFASQENIKNQFESLKRKPMFKSLTQTVRSNLTIANYVDQKFGHNIIERPVDKVNLFFQDISGLFRKIEIKRKKLSSKIEKLKQENPDIMYYVVDTFKKLPTNTDEIKNEIVSNVTDLQELVKFYQTNGYIFVLSDTGNYQYYPSEITRISHQSQFDVIGSEYSKIITVLWYSKKTEPSYYDVSNGIYEAMTRAKDSLTIIHFSTEFSDLTL